MNSREFYSLVKSKFPFDPTVKQDIVLNQLSEFIFSMSPDLLYVLKGYAGTGKTTIIGALVSNLWKAKKSAVLMAPTGRAAKVISNYSIPFLSKRSKYSTLLIPCFSASA